jgi:hypothetical protein
MASMLLLNPRGRRRRAKTRRAHSRKANPFLFGKKRRSSRRSAVARNPARRYRRRNPIALRHHHRARRRRNPIGAMGGGIIHLLTDAGIMAAGAVGFDLLYGQINGMLPTSLQVNASTVGAGDAVKLGIAVALGALLDKPTKGMSRKLATGALTVQLYDIASGMMPATMSSGMAGVGYVQPSAVVNLQTWNKPNRNMRGAGVRGVGALVTGNSPSLRALTRPGAMSPSQKLASVYPASGMGFR